MVNLKEHGTVGWTDDGLQRIRLAGSDPDHPWHFATTTAALDVVQAHGLLADYGQPPRAPRELLQAYPDLLRPPPPVPPTLERDPPSPFQNIR
ncbi:MAG: hypothetical protein ACP5QO_07615 [Clostridia bacterium]